MLDDLLEIATDLAGDVAGEFFTTGINNLGKKKQNNQQMPIRSNDDWEEEQSEQYSYQDKSTKENKRDKKIEAKQKSKNNQPSQGTVYRGATFNKMTANRLQEAMILTEILGQPVSKSRRANRQSYRGI